MSQSVGRAQLFAEALKHHRAGRFDAAGVLYLKVLELQPHDADAMHLLGLVRRQQGSAAEAAMLIANSVVIRPDSPDALCNLANILYELGRLTEAEVRYREALRFRPDFADCHSNLGGLLNQLGRPSEAKKSCREALRLRPDCDDAYNNLGNALHALGRLADAEINYREALRLQPNSPEVYNNLGIVLRDLGRPEEAEASCREALRLAPDFAEAHSTLGNVLCALGRPAEAEASFRQALQLRSDFPEAHNNLGNLLYTLGRLPEAEARCRDALRLRPDFADAHHNLAYILLLAGQLEEGWEEYEWRWKTKRGLARRRHFSAPLWCRDAVGDRVILLHAEQGFGDTLQFCRYVPLIGADARIVLEVQAPLVRLMSRLTGVEKIIAFGDPLPSFDLHCRLLSLPRAFHTTLDTLPAGIPYLNADPALAAEWRKRLAATCPLRVGLAWASNPDPSHDEARQRDRRNKSMTIEHLAPPASVTGVNFVSLQLGEAAAQAHTLPPGLVVHDFTRGLYDFADTAALIDELDLVISVDTAVAHLAGALGKPVWLLNRFDTDWRWLLNREDSPWYPTLRQFRQPAPGDWQSVVKRVCNDLQRLADG